MSKRYLAIITVLVVLVGCFFLFFEKPTSKELYNKYLEKIEKVNEFSDLSSNEELNIEIDDKYINNQYHYVVTFTSNTVLNNFKALVVGDKKNSKEYYPSFGIIDNENINLVNNDAKEDETKGINLVVTSREKIEAFKVYVSYNNYEYFYLINMEE